MKNYVGLSSFDSNGVVIIPLKEYESLKSELNAVKVELEEIRPSHLILKKAIERGLLTKEQVNGMISERAFSIVDYVLRETEEETFGVPEI